MSGWGSCGDIAQNTIPTPQTSFAAGETSSELCICVQAERAGVRRCAPPAARAQSGAWMTTAAQPGPEAKEAGGESRHTVEPQRHQVADLRMVTRRLNRAQGQCPGFPASAVPRENRVAKPSFQDLRQEPTVGHHLSRHATPSRADLKSALEDVRRSCSSSGRGHNPGASLSSSNVLRAYRFLKSYGAERIPPE